MVNRMTRWSLTTLGATSVLALGVGSLYLASLPAAAEPAPPGEFEQAMPSYERPAAGYGIGRLGEKTSSLDVLPAKIDPANLGTSGLDQHQARYLGADAETKYWAAIDKSGYVCLVAFIDAGEDWLAGAGCSAPDSFLEHGTNVRLSNSTTVIEGYLLPDIAGTLDLSELGAMQLGTNLVVVDPSATKDNRRAATATANRSGIADGSTFDLMINPDPFEIAKGN